MINKLATLLGTEGRKSSGQAKSVTGTDYGDKRALDVSIHGPLTAFGELAIAEHKPLIQIDAVYGIRGTDVETFIAGTGTATAKTDHGGREFECTTGTTIYSYGVIRSLRSARYRPGLGMLARWTCRYSTPVTNCRMASGLFTSGVELSFGYFTGAATNGTFDGTEFGILYRTSGRQEVRTLTIATPASGAETLTITLNGVAYSVDVTAGTAAFNAKEIAADSDFGITQTWSAYQNGDTVIFVNNSIGTATGTYSIASTGALAGSIAQTSAGKAAVDTFYPQDEWSEQTLLSGTFVLDHTKLNVFQISYQYLGAGVIHFLVEDPNTGLPELVHIIKYPNSAVVPSLDNPTFKVGWFAASLGSTTDVSVHGASGAIFLEGQKNSFRQLKSHGNSKSAVTTTLTNIITIRNRAEFNGFVNLQEVLPESVTVAVDGTKPAVVEVHRNATLGGTPNWTTHDSESIIEYDLSGTTVTGGKEIYGAAVGKSEAVQVRFPRGEVWLNRNDTLTIAVKATSGTTDVTAYINWVED